MRRTSSRTALLVLGGALAVLPAPTRASSSYPTEIQKQLALSYMPACAICHTNGVTGTGTVTTPFGEAMRANGLVCCDIATLDSALAALEGEMSPYITDLKENIDPNDPNESASSPLTYGCFNTTGEGPVPGPTSVFLVGLGLLLLARARSGRR